MMCFGSMIAMKQDGGVQKEASLPFSASFFLSLINLK